MERGDAIEFEVSLPLNLLNHVLVLAGVNYTYGFYLDLAKGVSLHLLAELSSSGLREAWWNLAASILASDLNTAEDLFDAIDEFAAFLHDGVKPCKLRLWTSEEAFRKLSEAYPEAGSWDSLLADLRNKLSRGTLGLLRRALEECYNSFYAEYWEVRREVLHEISCRLKKAVDVLQPLKKLEEMLGIELRCKPLRAFPVDVFRLGRGIYGVEPNRIVCTSDRRSPLSIHLDVAHEVTHILVGDWKLELADDVRELAGALKVRKSLELARVLEEHVAALMQLKVDEAYIGKRRVTHGYMENETFRVAEEVWDRSRRELGASWTFREFMKELIEELKKSRKAARELAELAKGRS